jgi:ribose/xylose/arabinose/galactoside ABC-type transport system permease subunit
MHDRDVLPDSQAVLTPSAGRFPLSSLLAGVLRHNRRNAGLLLALLACLLILAIFSPKYMNPQNFIVIGLQASYVGIASLGMTLLIISGNVDLSIGSLFALTAVTSAMLARVLHPQVALLAGILLGGLIGLLNGAMVWRIRLSPIIITLGSLTVLRGVVLLLTGGYGIRGVPDSFGWLGQGRPLEVPMQIWILFALVVVVSFMLHTTTIGRHIYAIGGNREASEAAGLNVRRLVLGVFLVNGLIVGLAGVLAASRFVTATPAFGLGYELDVITAVILGGVAFTGGEGNIPGVMLAVLLLVVLNSGMVSLGIDPHYTEVVKGGALILAVTLDQLAHERQERFRTLLAMRERHTA